MVICLQRGADLHTAQLMPLPLTVSCKIQIGFTFLVPAHPGSHGQRAIKRVCVFSFCLIHTLISLDSAGILGECVPERAVPWHAQNSECRRGSYERLVLNSDGTHRCRAAPLHGCTGSTAQQQHDTHYSVITDIRSACSMLPLNTSMLLNTVFTFYSQLYNQLYSWLYLQSRLYNQLGELYK